MSPVEKASGAVEMASPFLADPILQKRLNEGNIREVLLSLQGYSLNDVLDYLEHQSQKLTDLLQYDKNMAAEAEPPEFLLHMMPQMGTDKTLSQKDLQEFQMMMNELFEQNQDKVQQKLLQEKAVKKSVAGQAKDATGGKTSAAEDPKKATAAEALADAQNTSADAQFLLDSLMDPIFDVQLRMQMEEKNEELKAEMDRILALVRSGKVSPVWILVSLAKVNSSRNGFLFTQMGNKLMRLNQQATKVVDDLFTKATGDPNLYAAELQKASQIQKEQGMQQQFLLQDMQKLTQNIESVLSFAKKSIDEIFKTKLHIVNAPFKNL